MSDPRSARCPFCKGTGACSRCNGSGTEAVRRRWFRLRGTGPCGACGGSGICQLCHGTVASDTPSEEEPAPVEHNGG